MGEMSVTELWTLLLAGASAIILLMNLADKLAGVWAKIKAPDKQQTERIGKLEKESARLNAEVEAVKAKTERLEKHHEADMDESREERGLIIHALLACLNGLQQLGCNSTVTSTANEISDYINKKAHEK